MSSNEAASIEVGRKRALDPESLLANATPGDWYVDGLMIAANPCVSIAVLAMFDSFGNIHDAPNAMGNGAIMAAAPALARELTVARAIIRDILDLAISNQAEFEPGYREKTKRAEVFLGASGAELKKRKFRLPGEPECDEQGRRIRLLHPIEFKELLCERQGNKCHWCKLPMGVVPEDAKERRFAMWLPTFEHLIPFANGGADDETNIVAAHRICNEMRSR